MLQVKIGKECYLFSYFLLLGHTSFVYSFMLWDLFKTALGVFSLTYFKIYGRRGSGLFRELQDQLVLQIQIM